MFRIQEFWTKTNSHFQRPKCHRISNKISNWSPLISIKQKFNGLSIKNYQIISIYNWLTVFISSYFFLFLILLYRSVQNGALHQNSPKLFLISIDVTRFLFILNYWMWCVCFSLNAHWPFAIGHSIDCISIECLLSFYRLFQFILMNFFSPLISSHCVFVLFFDLVAECLLASGPCNIYENHKGSQTLPQRQMKECGKKGNRIACAGPPKQ